MKAIQTLGLTKRYGSRVACQAVHLSVSQGEIFSLLGPNGAGKSTLVKTLVGLVHPSAGTARVLGRFYRDPKVRREIGYLPELFRYQPWLTTYEVLRFHANLLGKPIRESEMERLLADVGLEGRGRERVKSLSKGLQQRLGLAVALLGEPRVVFLDEPTSALDPVGRHEVGELLKRLRQRGMTIFLNSHLLADVEKLSDSVALIDRGQVLYQGSLQEAMRGEAQKFTYTTSWLPQALTEALQAQYPVRLEHSGSEMKLHCYLRRDQLPEIHRLLNAWGIDVYEVEGTHQSLEEWFLTRLGRISPQ
jgi:ABC-2 type transport system ATP-binding protein